MSNTIQLDIPDDVRTSVRRSMLISTLKRLNRHDLNLDQAVAELEHHFKSAAFDLCSLEEIEAEYVQRSQREESRV